MAPTTAVQTRPRLSDTAAAIMERVVIVGDLSRLTEKERITYYEAVCESLQLNPLTRPFDYIMLQGKLTLYARRDCADQLRRIHGVSIIRVEFLPVADDILSVIAYAKAADGREDVDLGAVAIRNMQGEFLANARMKAITKAKRRVTLSICGLGLPDETEVDDIPDATPMRVNLDPGEILDAGHVPMPQAKAEATPRPVADTAARPVEVEIVIEPTPAPSPARRARKSGGDSPPAPPSTPPTPEVSPEPVTSQPPGEGEAKGPDPLSDPKDPALKTPIKWLGRVTHTAGVSATMLARLVIEAKRYDDRCGLRGAWHEFAEFALEHKLPSIYHLTEKEGEELNHRFLVARGAIKPDPEDTDKEGGEGKAAK